LSFDDMIQENIDLSDIYQTCLQRLQMAFSTEKHVIIRGC
jgi:hypothetical protein